MAVIALSMILPPIYQAKHRLEIISGHPTESNIWQMISSQDPLLMSAWTIASAGLVLWGVLHALHVAYLARGRRTKRVEVDGVPVVVTESLGPATIGALRPRVLIPRWVLALPEAQRKYVVLHEEEHRKANDARMLFLTSLLLILTPWNLALWWLLRRLRTIRSVTIASICTPG